MVVLVVAVGLIASVFAPFHSTALELKLLPGSAAAANFSVPQSSWVTVHIEHRGSMSMTYWMDGPTGGAMFDHRGMMGQDAYSYSFGTWGGPFQCWAEYGGNGSVMTTVWVNVTWGLL